MSEKLSEIGKWKTGETLTGNSRPNSNGYFGGWKTLSDRGCGLWTLGFGPWALSKNNLKSQIMDFYRGALGFGLWALGFKRKQFQVLDTNYGNGWKRRGERKENVISETIRTFL